MHGSLDIRRSNGGAPEVYQVRYEDLAGDYFAASMDEKELHDLLYNKLPIDLDSGDLDSAYTRLKNEGHVTFSELEIKEEELTGAGLQYLPQAG
jgi:hypothetical protein